MKMTLDEVVDEIRQSVAVMSERLSHMVSWKDLLITAAALFVSVVAAMWFVVAARTESALAGATTQLQKSSSMSITKAQNAILDEMRVALGEISMRLDRQQEAIVEASSRTPSPGLQTVFDVKWATDIRKLSSQISKLELNLNEVIVSRPAYVSIDPNGKTATELFLSETWENFSKQSGIDARDIATSGEISIPITGFTVGP